MSMCFAAYMLFAGTLSWSEALTGAVLSAVGAAGAVLLTRVSARHFTFSTPHARVWGRAMVGVPLATVQTGLALARQLASPVAHPGRAETRAFRRGKADKPEDRARRVTATLASSLAPNTFVIDLPLHHEEALLHGIDHRPPTTNSEWLA